MLMMGRLMLGKRSMGRRPTETKPRMVTASAAMSTAMALRRARKVSHMELFRRFRAHLLAFADQFLALHDERLVTSQALADLDQRALTDPRGHGPPAHHAVLDNGDQRFLVLDGDGLVGDQDGARMMVDDELGPRVHARLEEVI